jgi:hypothetical protein
MGRSWVRASPRSPVRGSMLLIKAADQGEVYGATQLKFARHRQLWRSGLYEARRRFALCVPDYTVTCHHSHWSFAIGTKARSPRACSSSQAAWGTDLIAVLVHLRWLVTVNRRQHNSVFRKSLFEHLAARHPVYPFIAEMNCIAALAPAKKICRANSSPTGCGGSNPVRDASPQPPPEPALPASP